MPFNLKGDPFCLGEIRIGSGELEVELRLFESESRCVSSEIWEHTIHELESLACSLRCAAGGRFPWPIEVDSPESFIGPKVNLNPVVECELGYSIHNPNADRAMLYCSSRDWGSIDRKLGVKIGLAMKGAFAEAVLEPAHAIDLADWLDCQLQNLMADN